MARAMAITPVLRYRDADTAARWLCEAFGFQEHDRAQELNGYVRYILLRLGDGFVLVRPVANSVLDDFMVQPEAIGGANTQTCYLTIPDADEHSARSEAAGAKVEIKPRDDGLGGRFYTCRDLDGHLWSFGTRSYGAAHANAFEPVEMAPSLSSTGNASGQGHIGRAPARRGQLLPAIGIACAAVVLIVGGWVYYDTYAGSALREAAATSAATAYRLEETVKQLAHERSRRLVAEAASQEAATKLTEERAVVAQLGQAVQRAKAELADMHQEKGRAVRALETSNELSQKHRLARDRAEAEMEVAKSQLAEAKAKLVELASADPTEAQVQLAKQEEVISKQKDELQETKTALLAANRKLEELRAGQLEPMGPDGADPVSDNSLCVLAVQGKIALGHKGPTTWAAADLSRLCRGAEASEEPAKCFQEIMRGKINWGAGTTWVTSNALALCGGTHSARQTVDCFKSKISSSQPWKTAIAQCRTK